MPEGRRRIEIETEIAEYKREEKRKRDAERELRRKRREMGVCQYCGSKFKGFFIKKCSVCGLEKDY